MPFRTPGLSLPLRGYLTTPLDDGARFWSEQAVEVIKEHFPFFDTRPVAANHRIDRESIYFRGDERVGPYIGLNPRVVLDNPFRAYALTFERQAQAMVLELSRGRNFRQAMRQAVYEYTKVSLPRFSPVIGSRARELERICVQAKPSDPLIVLYRKAITHGMQQFERIYEDDVVGMNPFYKAVMSVAKAAYATESRASVVGSETPISRRIEGMRLDAVIPRLAKLGGLS